MKYDKFPDNETVDSAIEINDPLVILISFDSETVILASVVDTVEHQTLLAQTGRNALDVDKYFRIVVDKTGADWTFVCPHDYKHISDRQKRIQEFYKDGFTVISDVLASLGYIVGINIPYRYSRHFKAMSDE